MLIACKYEEIWAAEVGDFISIADNYYSRQQILSMEKNILNSMAWNLTVPTPYVFLVRFAKAATGIKELANMIFFFAEMALMEYELVTVVKYLIVAFDIVNSVHEQGNTALHIAAFRGHLPVVEALMTASPSLISARNEVGDTFLHMALTGFRTLGFRRLDRQMELTKHLVSGSIMDVSDVINVQNDDGRIVLHLAVVVLPSRRRRRSPPPPGAPALPIRTRGGGGGGSDGEARGRGAATGVDFHLPDEILAVIPTDPYEQLDVARKITSMAIASRVSRLEADVARLRRDLADRDRGEADLRARLADSDARLLAALDENAKLVKERDTLAVTAKKLARNLAKLEAFKKQLMKSLSEDNLLQLSETGEDRDVDAENDGTARFLPGKMKLQAVTPLQILPADPQSPNQPKDTSSQSHHM
ncbi:hypothetical protein ZWY2020_013559 [Hordeum vulgare]|nr:hypothetical protein ZWY2020_013559 [Hordeum vulgare]